MHDVAEAAEKVPAVQIELALSPIDEQELPAGQAGVSLSPVEAQRVPIPQLAHAVWDGLGWYLPGEQFVHDVAEATAE